MEYLEINEFGSFDFYLCRSYASSSTKCCAFSVKHCAVQLTFVSLLKSPGSLSHCAIWKQVLMHCSRKIRRLMKFCWLYFLTWSYRFYLYYMEVCIGWSSLSCAQNAYGLFLGTAFVVVVMIAVHWYLSLRSASELCVIFYVVFRAVDVSSRFLSPVPLSSRCFKL